MRVIQTTGNVQSEKIRLKKSSGVPGGTFSRTYTVKLLLATQIFSLYFGFGFARVGLEHFYIIDMFSRWERLHK